MISEGDSIFVHSNIGFFGILKEAQSQKDYFELFKRAIFEVIGSTGTLIVPTFSYSFCRKEPFIREKTAGVCGFFSEQTRQDIDAVRSDDANFSIAAIGSKKHFFTSPSPDYSFGSNSFWEKFLLTGGKFCNFNFDSGSTFIHYIERKLKVPYRFDKEFPGLLISNGKEQKRSFYHFCYDLKKKQHAPFFDTFHNTAYKQGATTSVDLGRGQLVVISADDTFTLIKRELENDPSFLIKGSCE